MSERVQYSDPDLECSDALLATPPQRTTVVRMASLMLAVAGTAVATTLLTLKAVAPQQNLHADETLGLYEMAVKPAYDKCAKPTQNCAVPKCCGPTGYTCYKISENKGKCMKECTPSAGNGSCVAFAPHTKTVVEEPGSSLFCFSAYTENTGVTKKNYELELLQQQRAKGVSLFQCADWAVYSDVEAPLGDGHVTTMVHDSRGEFHLLRRLKMKTWINTPMYIEIWTAIRAAKRWETHNWVVKVDADAVFFPYRLTEALKSVTVPDEGLYLENCKYVDYGYFGSLEVFSHKAFDTLSSSLDECYNQVPWKVGVKKGKYGPMGEDLFAQECMDLKGVSKMEHFGLTTDGTCPADRPKSEEKNLKFIPECDGVTTPAIHPFKKPAAYFKCLEASER